MTFRPFCLTCRLEWASSYVSAAPVSCREGRVLLSRLCHVIYILVTSSPPYLQSNPGRYGTYVASLRNISNSEASNIKLDLSKKLAMSVASSGILRNTIFFWGEINSTLWQWMWNTHSGICDAHFNKRNHISLYILLSFYSHLKLIRSYYPETDCGINFSAELWVTKEILKRSEGEEICNRAPISPILITLLISHATHPLGTN